MGMGQPESPAARCDRMRKIIGLLVIALALPLASMGWAQEAPIRLPKPRPIETPVAPPAAETVTPPAADTAAPTEPTINLPRSRPDPDAKPAVPDAPPAEAKPDAPPADAAVPVEAVPDPEEPPAPPRIYQSACPAVLSGQVEAKLLPPISDKQCGAQSPFLVTSVLVNGRMVPLSGGVTTTCGMATALPAWLASIDGYLFAKENTHVSEVMMGTSYMCRNVNNGSGGNLSFHAFADALDVMGFKLEDGRTVTVEGGWGDALSSEGRMLRFAHDSACAQFTTTLGPEANAQHHDHLHIDMGCHGKTCTARLCE